MLTNNDRITVSQAVALVITTILGTGALSLPRNVAHVAGSDGWLLVLLGGVFAFASSLIAGVLVKRFPQDTFIEYSQKVLGKMLGYPLGVVLMLYFMVISALTVRTFSEVINTFMLKSTPREFLILSMMLVSVYLMRHGIEPIARIGEVLLPVLIVPVIAMYLTAVPKADFSELLPILTTPAKALVLGTFQTVYSFFGFEVLLLVGPYVRNPGRVFWILLVAIGSITLMYLYVVIIAYATLGMEDARILLWPSMSVIRTVRAPGGIFERLDALAMALWTIAVFTTINGMYYSGTLSAAHLTKSREFKFFVTIMFPWVYLISIMPDNPMNTAIWTRVAGVLGIIMAVIIPAIILMVSIFRKKGGK